MSTDTAEPDSGEPDVSGAQAAMAALFANAAGGKAPVAAAPTPDPAPPASDSPAAPPPVFEPAAPAAAAAMPRFTGAVVEEDKDVAAAADGDLDLEKLAQWLIDQFGAVLGEVGIMEVLTAAADGDLDLEKLAQWLVDQFGAVLTEDDIEQVLTNVAIAQGG